MVMETAELVEELEGRGFSVNRCEVPTEDLVPQICRKPATRHVGGLRRCEECHVRIVRREMRERYAVETGDMGVKIELVDAVHRMAMDGKAPEVIVKWVALTSGLSWEELCEVEAEVLVQRKMRLWVVVGRHKYGGLHDSALVLARSDAEARKLWRDHRYRMRDKDIPDNVEIVVTEVTGVKEPQIIADRPEHHLEYVIGMHGRVI